MAKRKAQAPAAEEDNHNNTEETPRKKTKREQRAEAVIKAKAAMAADRAKVQQNLLKKEQEAHASASPAAAAAAKKPAASTPKPKKAPAAASRAKASSAAKKKKATTNTASAPIAPTTSTSTPAAAAAAATVASAPPPAATISSPVMNSMFGSPGFALPLQAQQQHFQDTLAKLKQQQLEQSLHMQEQTLEQLKQQQPGLKWLTPAQQHQVLLDHITAGYQQPQLMMPNFGSPPPSMMMPGGFFPFAAAPNFTAATAAAAGPTSSSYPPPSAAQNAVPSVTATSTAAAKKPPAKKKNTVTKVSSPPAASLKAEKVVVDDDDEAAQAPPPPNDDLQRQVSLQVAQNVHASTHGKPLPYTQPIVSPPNMGGHEEESDDSDYLPQEDDDQRIDMGGGLFFPEQEDESPKRRGISFIQWISIFIILAGIVSAYLTEQELATNSNKIGPPPAAVVPEDYVRPCFLDSQARYRSEVVPGEFLENGKPRTKGVLVEPCLYQDVVEPCPEMAYCEDGKIVRCLDTFDFEIDDATQSKCQVKPDVLVAVGEWTTVLQQLTLDDQCQQTDEKAPFPLVDSQQLVDDYELPHLSMAVLKTHFKVVEPDGSSSHGVLIGLPEDYSLPPLPLSCRISHVAKSFLGGFIESILAMVRALLNGILQFGWLSLKTYPKASLVILIVGYLYHKWSSRKAWKRRVALDVVNLRDAAFIKLQASSEESHYDLGLRDALIVEMTSRDWNDKRRQYYRQQVWPRVAAQLSQDYRLRQSHHVVDGKTQTHYQWIGTRKSPSATKKKVVRMAEQ